MPAPDPLAPYAGADIYLLDQILRGHIRAGMAVLDVGCGSGRNLIALAARGCMTTGIDRDPLVIDEARSRLAAVQPTPTPTPTLLACDVETMPFAPGSFAVVLVNAVLHFAPDSAAFHRWADACWRQVAPGGMLLARLSTRICLPDARPPGFSYLASEDDLLACEGRWRATRADPLKTTQVERMRTMTTWVLRRRGD